ncbi:hypothetical protein pipiens_017977 [Culex pipiens pipiens]|uniref:Uncharacterized protein n=1 Tax=Culex pipiens pipiens TaxID=38569 RepID=A0ABD1CF55_CULPP
MKAFLVVAFCVCLLTATTASPAPQLSTALSTLQSVTSSLQTTITNLLTQIQTAWRAMPDRCRRFGSDPAQSTVTGLSARSSRPERCFDDLISQLTAATSNLNTVASSLTTQVNALLTQLSGVLTGLLGTVTGTLTGLPTLLTGLLG